MRRLLQQHCASVEMKRRDFVSGTWAPCLLRALQLRVHYPNVRTLQSQKQRNEALYNTLYTKKAHNLCTFWCAHVGASLAP